MKKRILIICSILIAFSGMMGIAYVNRPVNAYPLQTSQAYWPETLQKIENDCDIAIRGRVMPGSENKLFYDKRSLGQPAYGETFTKIEVLEVYSGNIIVGDMVDLLEPYFTMDTLTEIQLFYIENYHPSDTGKEYVFFLKKSTHPDYFHMYFPLGVEYGRYPVLREFVPSAVRNDDNISQRNVGMLTNEELNLGALNSNRYRSFYQEVVDTYFINLDTN